MVKLFLYGTPDGFSCSECGEKDRALLEGCSVRNQNGNILYGKRMDNGNVYYNYSIYPEKGKIFTDRNGKAGSFFGMAMVFENQEVKDTKKLEKLFKEVYKNYVKDRIVQDLPNGDKRYLIETLNIPGDAIGRYVAQGAAVDLIHRLVFHHAVPAAPEAVLAFHHKVHLRHAVRREVIHMVNVSCQLLRHRAQHCADGGGVMVVIILRYNRY